jgi:hypothetical protein
VTTGTWVVFERGESGKRSRFEDAQPKQVPFGEAAELCSQEKASELGETPRELRAKDLSSRMCPRVVCVAEIDRRHLMVKARAGFGRACGSHLAKGSNAGGEKCCDPQQRGNAMMR